jgi:exosortase
MPLDQKLEVSVRTDLLHLSFRRLVAPRNALFAALTAASAIVFWTPLGKLLALSMSRDEYSHLILIPPTVLGLFYVEKRRIFQCPRYSIGTGVLTVLVGMLLAGAAALSGWLGSDWRLCLEILGLITILIGGFVLCYGTNATRSGIFALLFSLLLVPLPLPVMAQPIGLIQHASAEVTALLFRLSGVPVFREGMTFSMPRLTFVVAEECSGIHSSIALFIGSLLGGHFYLKSAWRKGVLVALVFPIVSFTNGLRMFALATLAVYVDMRFFYGNLHHRGGVIFFSLGLAILALMIKLLRGRARLYRPAPSTQSVLPTAQTSVHR